MRSYLLKASDEEMDRWREAAGGESLAAFLRRAANALADGALFPVMVVESHDAVMTGPSVLDTTQTAAFRNVMGREFRSDFKGQK